MKYQNKDDVNPSSHSALCISTNHTHDTDILYTRNLLHMQYTTTCWERCTLRAKHTKRYQKYIQNTLFQYQRAPEVKETKEKQIKPNHNTHTQQQFGIWGLRDDIVFLTTYWLSF